MSRAGQVSPRVARLAVCVPALALLLGGSVAVASIDPGPGIRWSGAWPDESQELVTLSADALPRAEAIRRLADKAGWSVVVEGMPPGTIDLHVTRQPAAKVLQVILGGARAFSAQRQGNLVSITPVLGGTEVRGAGAGAPDRGADQDSGDEHHGAKRRDRSLPGAGGTSPERGEDRVVTGSSITIGPDEVVGDLVVIGGAADVRGQVTGDVAIYGGSVRVREGAHVFGDVATFGGSVKLDPGARIDGDVATIAGSVNRGADAAQEAPRHSLPASEPSPLRGVASVVGGAITRTALLFAFGVVLWALAGRRIERLQEEVVHRPMRAFALGVVGAVGGAVVLIVLCVTVIGIPVALVVGLASVVGAYAGVCAALTTVGAALLRHRTVSPYVHLALGCVVYLVLSAIPFVGGFVTAAVLLIGLGTLVGTRAAGLIKIGRRGGQTATEG